MENWEGRLLFSASRFICQQHSGPRDDSAGLSVLGRPSVKCQAAAALRRVRASQSRTELATCISEKLLIPFVSAEVASSL